MTLVFAAACSNSRTWPTSPSDLPVASTLPVELDAPSSVAPGTTVQLRLFTVSGGQKEDVTSRATWRSTAVDVLAVDSAGRATGKHEGESGIEATFGVRSSARSVLVLEPDTWWMSGRVTDGGLAVANARVEVVDGAGKGKSAITDASGFFKLYGIGGAVLLRASADGFRPTDVSQTVSANGASVHIVLAPAEAPKQLAGDWTMTFMAAGDCASVPDAARVRSYRAMIEQSGSSLRVSLSGAQFALDHNREPQSHFTARVIGETLTIVLSETWSMYYGTTWDVAELIDASTTLSFAGTGTAIATGGMFTTGSFSGSWRVNRPGFGQISCTREYHQFSLTQ
jgi:hypothetical protein